MQIGCHLPTTQAPGATRDALLTFAREAERRMLVEFRRQDLGQMLEILDLVAGTVRPAVDAA